MTLRRRLFLALFSAAPLGLAACPGNGPTHPPGECGFVMDAGFSWEQDNLGTTYLDLRGRLLFPGARSVPAPYGWFGVCPPGYDYPTVSGVTVTAPSGAVLDATWHRNQGNVAVDFQTVEAG